MEHSKSIRKVARGIKNISTPIVNSTISGKTAIVNSTISGKTALVKGTISGTTALVKSTKSGKKALYGMMNKSSNKTYEFEISDGEESDEHIWSDEDKETEIRAFPSIAKRKNVSDKGNPESDDVAGKFKAPSSKHLEQIGKGIGANIIAQKIEKAKRKSNINRTNRKAERQIKKKTLRTQSFNNVLSGSEQRMTELVNISLEGQNYRNSGGIVAKHKYHTKRYENVDKERVDDNVDKEKVYGNAYKEKVYHKGYNEKDEMAIDQLMGRYSLADDECLRENDGFWNALLDESRRRKVILSMTSGILILFILITGVTVGGWTASHGSSSQPQAQWPMELTPTPSPSSPPNSSMSDIFLELLLPISPSLQSLPPSSPQVQAFQWLIERNVDDIPAGRIKQIYILATVYFSTNGRNWAKTNNWLISTNECRWTGIHCALRSEELKTIIMALGNMGLQGTIPDEIGELVSLEKVWLNRNMLFGKIPTSFERLGRLTDLSLDYNNLTGTIPSIIGEMDSLLSINFSHNKLQQNIPNGLGNIVSLRSLDLSDNLLSGEFPEALSNLKELKFLYLDRNRISGRIDDWIFGLEKLRTLSLAENEMDGEIHPDIGEMTNLEELDLSDNAFSGTLPFSMSHLLNLKLLNVSKNDFNGIIPDFQNLNSLKEGYFDRNKFAGVIPEWIGASGFTELTLQANSFQGEVSQSICVQKPHVISCDCLGDNPKVTCNCCEGCY